MTTGTAYSIVDEPTSEINGASSTQTGQPWEFLAGLDHTEYNVSWGQGYHNAYVTYACVWSVLEVETALGKLDMLYKVVERTVREDCVIADINGDEKVDIYDVRIATKAYDAWDEGDPGPDGKYYTDDDRYEADTNWDARADVKDCVHVIPAGRGHVDIFDVRRVSKDYGKKLTPDGIIET